MHSSALRANELQMVKCRGGGWGVFGAFLWERWWTAQTMRKRPNLALKPVEVSGLPLAEQLCLNQSFGIPQMEPKQSSSLFQTTQRRRETKTKATNISCPRRKSRGKPEVLWAFTRHFLWIELLASFNERLFPGSPPAWTKKRKREGETSKTESVAGGWDKDNSKPPIPFGRPQAEGRKGNDSRK